MVRDEVSELTRVNCVFTMQYFTGTATPQSISCGKKWKKTDHQTNTTATTKRKRKRRIVGGVTSEGGEWPWHISLQMKGTHVCGGSILSPSVIVTAAHCVGMCVDYIAKKTQKKTCVLGFSRNFF